MKQLQRTNRSIVLSLLGVGLAISIALPGLSHHSHAMFDHTVEVTITGTVRDFSFRNPHVFLYVDVKADNGDVVTWSVEMSNIGNTIRRGIGGSTFKVGDVVTVTMNPLTNGQSGGNYTSITTADGQTYQ